MAIRGRRRRAPSSSDSPLVAVVLAGWMGGGALATAVAAVVVVTVGALPLLGLVVPNVVSRLVGDDARRGLPLVALLGAVTVLVCDIVGRSLPGLFAGTLLTFIPATGDFINAELLGTPRQFMIGNVIQSKFLEILDYPTAAALSFLLMAFILIGIFLYARALGTRNLTEAAL